MDEAASPSPRLQLDDHGRHSSGVDILVSWIVAIAIVAIVAVSSWSESAKVDDLGLSMRRATHTVEMVGDRSAGRTDPADRDTCDPEDRPDQPLISAPHEIGETDDGTVNC